MGNGSSGLDMSNVDGLIDVEDADITVNSNFNLNFDWGTIGIIVGACVAILIVIFVIVYFCGRGSATCCDNVCCKGRALVRQRQVQKDMAKIQRDVAIANVVAAQSNNASNYAPGNASYVNNGYSTVSYMPGVNRQQPLPEGNSSLYNQINLPMTSTALAKTSNFDGHPSARKYALKSSSIYRKDEIVPVDDVRMGELVYYRGEMHQMVPLSRTNRPLPSKMGPTKKITNGKRTDSRAITNRSSISNRTPSIRSYPKSKNSRSYV